MEIIIPIIAAVVGIGGGAGAVFVYNKRNENGGKNKADDLVRKAKNEAQDIVSKYSNKNLSEDLKKLVRKRRILLKNQNLMKMSVVKSGVRLKIAFQSVKLYLMENSIRSKRNLND